MPAPAPQPRPLRAPQRARIAACCGHAAVPPAPAARGYRYYELGGETQPFYLRRLDAGAGRAAVVLEAPIERLAGEPAEPGAHAVARVRAVLDGRSLAPSAALAEPSSAALGRALDELAGLDLLRAGDCPLCS